MYDWPYKKESGKRRFLESRQVWAKLKESENVCSDYFVDPFDDNESPQDKTTCEEEEKEDAELEMVETWEAIWSSCSVGKGLYEDLAMGHIHVFSMQTSTVSSDEILQT